MKMIKLLLCLIVTFISTKNLYAITLEKGQTICLKNPSPAPNSFDKMTFYWRITDWTPIKPAIPDSIDIDYDLYDSNWNLIFHNDMSIISTMIPPFYSRGDFGRFSGIDLTPFWGSYAYFVFKSNYGTFEFDESSFVYKFTDSLRSEQGQLIPPTSSCIIDSGQTLCIKNPTQAPDFFNLMCFHYKILNWTPLQPTVPTDLILDYDLYDSNWKLIHSYHDLPIRSTTPPLDMSSDVGYFNQTDLTPFYGNYAYYVFTSKGGKFEFDCNYFTLYYLSEYKQQAQLISTNFVNENDILIPSSSYLLQNYPNPFNPKTSIEFGLPKSDIVTIKLFNILGQCVNVIVNCNYSSGKHVIEWNGENYSGGIYFYQLSTSSFVCTRKLLLLK